MPTYSTYVAYVLKLKIVGHNFPHSILICQHVDPLHCTINTQQSLQSNTLKFIAMFKMALIMNE